MQIVPPQFEAPSAQALGRDVPESAIKLTIPQKQRRRALILPREHGAWGMLLIPLATGAIIGLLAGGSIAPVLLLTAAVVALFCLRTPVESWLGTSAVTAQTQEERQLVRAVILPLATIAVLTLTALFWQGRNRGLAEIGMIAVTAFGAQMVLKRIGRATRMGAEMVGALALTSTAPAAYCVAVGTLDASAWVLWLVHWLFASDQVHFVWLRIRGARAAGLSEKFTVGWVFLVGQIFLCGTLALGYHFSRLPKWTPLAFAPVVFRGVIWFAKKPQPIVIRRLGWTELAHALLFGVLLTVSFCFVF